ncbi:DMT family transporter [Microlunatus soli]|uniref:Quaternary ammonium compound-resistance protein SugE n=1 Tax=Microlunatus soli TaxID=630515 RepID=A0A1H1QNT3_9ACTN|nr:multidrug efflux SMR transporter [Microlunatus soli]SDS25141.1 quaternary ammonium compound-resistance protein SugE [Microlunatus soli]
MAWLILIVSAVFEAVWATALGLSDGLSRPLPAIVFFVGLAVSMVGLGRATRQIPIGTAYAVWVGIGAALTVGYAMATGAEATSIPKIIFISGIIVAVVGLKLVPGRPRGSSDAPAVEPEDHRTAD